MAGLVVWGAFTVVVVAFCFWRPQPARVFVGVFFALMGLGIHGALILSNPQSYVDFATSAPIPVYRDIGLALTEPHPRAFGLVMLVFETAVSVLMLSRGRYVKIGLLGGILFLLGITPLGIEEWPNAVLAVGMAHLMTHTFPTDAVTMVRHRLHRRADRPPPTGSA